jgi:hypothetical protein
MAVLSLAAIEGANLHLLTQLQRALVKLAVQPAEQPNQENNRQRNAQKPK